MTSSRTRRNLTPQRLAVVIVIGLLAGFLAGLFGVGGGMIIVPSLLIVLDMSQRQAAATSLSAIIVTAAAGSITYAFNGNLSVPAMLYVSIGALIGAQLGTWLLRIIPEPVLPWIFVFFCCWNYYHSAVSDSPTPIIFRLHTGICYRNDNSRISFWSFCRFNWSWRWRNNCSWIGNRSRRWRLNCPWHIATSDDSNCTVRDFQQFPPWSSRSAGRNHHRLRRRFLNASRGLGGAIRFSPNRELSVQLISHSDGSEHHPKGTCSPE